MIPTVPSAKTSSVAETANGAATQSNAKTGMKPKLISARLNRMGECIFTKAFWLTRAHEPSRNPTIKAIKLAGATCHRMRHRKIMSSSGCHVFAAIFWRNGTGSPSKTFVVYAGVVRCSSLSFVSGRTLLALAQLCSMSCPLWRFETKLASDAKSSTKAPIQISFMLLPPAETDSWVQASVGNASCRSARSHKGKPVHAAASSANLRGRDSRQLRLIAERTLRRRPVGSGQVCLELPGDRQPIRAGSAEDLDPLCQRKSWRSRDLWLGTRAWCLCCRESAAPLLARGHSPSPQHFGTRARP